jgi:hypothetical protein
MLGLLAIASVTTLGLTTTLLDKMGSLVRRGVEFAKGKINNIRDKKIIEEYQKEDFKLKYTNKEIEETEIQSNDFPTVLINLNKNAKTPPSGDANPSSGGANTPPQ